MATLSINSDNVIELRNLKDAVTGGTVTTATVTVTLKNASGVEVTGGSGWPLAMPHIASGLYRAILPNELVLNVNLAYVGTVVADNGPEQHKEWCVKYSAACDA